MYIKVPSIINPFIETNNSNRISEESLCINNHSLMHALLTKSKLQYFLGRRLYLLFFFAIFRAFVRCSWNAAVIGDPFS